MLRNNEQQAVGSRQQVQDTRPGGSRKFWNKIRRITACSLSMLALGAVFAALGCEEADTELPPQDLQRTQLLEEPQSDLDAESTSSSSAESVTQEGESFSEVPISISWNDTVKEKQFRKVSEITAILTNNTERSFSADVSMLHRRAITGYFSTSLVKTGSEARIHNPTAMIPPHPRCSCAPAQMNSNS